ncbi:hypothetical protein D9M68_668560 [compost metagenome]
MVWSPFASRVARDRIMKLGAPGAVLNSGSSGCSGMKIISVLLLLTRSSPWSKNWPKKVNHELKGAERPSSGVVFGISSSVPGGMTTPWRSYRTPAASSVPRPAATKALTAAGLLLVMSATRLLISRGSASTTFPALP